MGTSGGSQVATDSEDNKSADFMQDLMGWFEDIQEMATGFSEGGGFTPELLEMMGTFLPMLEIYNTFGQADYQKKNLENEGYRLDLELAQLGLQGEQIENAKKQIEFQNGPYWKWYTNEYFPNVQKTDQMQNRTARLQAKAGGAQARAGIAQARSQEAISLQNTMQAEEGTEQARMATEAARYQMLQALGMGSAGRSSDGRNVRGSAYSYGYT